MFFIKIYIKQSYINCYHTSIQMCGQYCILAPILPKMNRWSDCPNKHIQISAYWTNLLLNQHSLSSPIACMPVGS